MSQPPPQYILPPASLPLVPVRPTLPSNNSNGGGTKSARASNNIENGGVDTILNSGENNRNSAAGSLGGESADTSHNESNATIDEYTRSISEHTTLPNGQAIEPSSVCSGKSDAENNMHRGNSAVNNNNSNNPNTISHAVGSSALGEQLNTQLRQQSMGLKNSARILSGNNNMAAIDKSAGTQREMDWGNSSQQAALDANKDGEDVSMDFPSIGVGEGAESQSQEAQAQAQQPQQNLGEQNNGGEQGDEEEHAIRIGSTGNPVGSLGHLLESPEGEMLACQEDNNEGEGGKLLDEIVGEGELYLLFNTLS